MGDRSCCALNPRAHLALSLCTACGTGHLWVGDGVLSGSRQVSGVLGVFLASVLCRVRDLPSSPVLLPAHCSRLPHHFSVIRSRAPCAFPTPLLSSVSCRAGLGWGGGLWGQSGRLTRADHACGLVEAEGRLQPLHSRAPCTITRVCATKITPTMCLLTLHLSLKCVFTHRSHYIRASTYFWQQSC